MTVSAERCNRKLWRLTGPALALMILLALPVSAAAGDDLPAAQASEAAGGSLSAAPVSEAAGDDLPAVSVSGAAAGEAAGTDGDVPDSGASDPANTQEQADTPREAKPEGSASGQGTGAGTVGTVILIGAGAYTAVRKKWKEKKPEQSYEYFENHTKNGTLRDEERYPNRDL